MIRRREILGVRDSPLGSGGVRGCGERGDTLIEVLLALMVLGLTAVALLLAFSTSISGSARHRDVATANTVLESASQLAIAQIQSNSNLFTCNFASPVTPTTFIAPNNTLSSFSTLPSSNYGSFVPTVTNVQYWNSVLGQFQATCIADAPIEVTIQVNGSGMTFSNSFVVNLPSGSLGDSSNTSDSVASQLVFTSPTDIAESATGEPGVAFSPQPVISALDGTNQLDATDLSPIVLSIESPNNGATISGCTADDPHGQATFSGCVISGPSAIYVVQASVLGQSLKSDPSGIGQDWNSVNASGSGFWQTSPTWYTTTFSVTVSGSPDQVTFAPAPVAQASGSLLQTQPIIKIVNPLTHLPDPTANGTVTLTLSGGELASCANLLPLGPTVTTSSNDEVITVNAIAGVVGLSKCTFSGAIFYNAAAYPAGPDPTTYTVTASYPTAVSALSTIAVSGPGAPTTLAFVVQPGGVASSLASTPLSPQPQVEIQDAFGNPEYNLGSANLTLSFASVGTATETISSYTQSLGGQTGIVTFSHVAGNAYGGNLELTAAFTGVSSATSDPFSISPLGGETMVFSTQPVAGRSGAELTTQPVITIYDKNGNVDTGLTTTISLTASGGLLSDCTGLTPDAGVVNVSTCLFSGTVGQPYTLTASFTDGLAQLISVTSNPISPTGAGTPTRILFVTPAGQPQGTVAGALLTTQPSVQIVDSWGNVVTSSAATISLTTAPSGGTLSGCANLTAVAGVVNVTGCTFGGTVNTFYTMTASSAGLTSATSNPFDVTLGGTPASVTIAPAPSSVSASNVTDAQLTIQLLDAWQNLTTSTSATILSLTSSSNRGFFATTNGQSGTLGASTLVSFPSGTGSISEYYGDENAGTPVISAQNTANLTAFGSGTLTVNAKTTNDTATLVQGNSQVATVNTAYATAMEVQVIDQFGNPVPNVAVTFTAPSSGASGSFGSTCTTKPNSYTCVATTNANGDATAAAFTASTTAGSFSVVASDPNVATPVTFSLRNSAGAASKIAITTQPTPSITAGGTESVSVSVEDTYGNLVSSTDSITVALSSKSFAGGTATLNAVGGVANFSGLQITAAGTYTITATDTPAHPTWTSTTNSFTVIAAAPAKIAITTQPASSITAGGTESVSVSVEDTYGNVAISTDQIVIALSSNSFAGGTTTLNAAGGVANFTGLQITAAGSYTITATDTPAHPTWTATTNSFTVIAAAPSKVIWKTQPGPGNSISGSNVVGPPTVEVEDTYNNPVNNATVTMAVTTGPPLATVVSGGTVTTGTDGVATFSSLVLGVAGNYTITASVGLAPSSVPSSSFTVNAGAAAAIMVWGGNGQSATVSTNFSSPLTAFVTDASGNPVGGATVTFTAPASGASGSFRAASSGGACEASGGTAVTVCTAATNASGIATSLTFAANAIQGASYSVTAGVTSGPTTPFTETNNGTFKFLTTAQNFATTTTDSGTSSGSVIIQAQDGNGNPVVQTTALTVALAYATTGVTLTTDPPTVTIPAGSSSVAFTVVSSTSANGGTFTITATNASYVTATQSETVQKDGSATGNAFTAIATQIVSPTTQTASFPLTITNSNGGNRYYKVSSVNGLLADESASPSSTCLTITTSTPGTITETVTTDETLPSPSRLAGSYTLDFMVQVYSTGGCTGTVINLQVDATLTVNTGSASTVAIAGGASQITANGTAFANPLTVFVSDAGGNPVGGTTVTFTAPASGASGSFRAVSSGGACLASGGSAVTVCTATANASGVASSLSFSANATVGRYTVAVTTTPTLTGSPLSFPEDNT